MIFALNLPNTFEVYFCITACGGNCLECDDSSKCTTCGNGFYLDGGECQRKCFVSTYMLCI